jgi:hypothetical protein
VTEHHAGVGTYNMNSCAQLQQCKALSWGRSLSAARPGIAPAQGSGVHGVAMVLGHPTLQISHTSFPHNRHPRSWVAGSVRTPSGEII